jgi:serine protease inhibitor
MHACKRKLNTCNVEIINKLSETKLNTYDKNCFFSTYGLFCLLDMLKNGSRNEIHFALTKLIVDQNVHTLAKSDDVFKNTSLIFHTDYLELHEKFVAYLKSNNILFNSIEMNKLQKKITEINQHLAEMTNDKIKNPLKADDFNEDFVMLLINVLYFCDEWVNQFEKAKTTKVLFQNGRNETVDMMCISREDYNYYENKSYQYIELPYSNYPYRMLIALPKGEAKLEHLDLSEALQNMDVYTVTTLMIPKFKIEQEEDLKEECIRMGLGKMFASSNDFDSMFSDSSPSFKKRISKIKQKTYINVDENGTEAACVTHAVMLRESFCVKPKLKEVEFVADHPFSFFVLGPNNLVLFAGKFYNY